jgi:hypothetical protein
MNNVKKSGYLLNSWMNKRSLRRVINTYWVVLVHEDNVLDDCNQYYARVRMSGNDHVEVEPISKGIYEHWSLSSWVRDDNGVVVGYEPNSTLDALSVEINYDPQYEYVPEVRVRTILMVFHNLYDYCLFKIRLEDAIKEDARRIEMGDF